MRLSENINIRIIDSRKYEIMNKWQLIVLGLVVVAICVVIFTAPTSHSWDNYVDWKIAIQRIIPIILVGGFLVLILGKIGKGKKENKISLILPEKRSSQEKQTPKEEPISQQERTPQEEPQSREHIIIAIILMGFLVAILVLSYLQRAFGF